MLSRANHSKSIDFCVQTLQKTGSLVQEVEEKDAPKAFKNI